MDDKKYFVCDAESLLNKEHSDYHAFLEYETAYHEGIKSPFLSLFTKRESKGDKVLGTEVWLNVDSVQDLIGELAGWALENGAQIEDLAEAIGLPFSDAESDLQDDDSGYSLSSEYDECPFCGSENVYEYSQPDWDEPAVWCDNCTNVLHSSGLKNS